jgi:hypothetical protein
VHEGRRHEPAAEQFADGGDDIRHARRQLAQLNQRPDHRGERVALLVDLRFERRVAGRKIARGHEVSLPDLRHAGHGVFGLRGRRVGGDLEQPVGNAAHGRHHHGGPGTVTAARSTNDLDEAADGFRVGHRRAAELLYDHGSERRVRRPATTCTKTPPMQGQNDVYSTLGAFLPSCNFCRTVPVDLAAGIVAGR